MTARSMLPQLLCWACASWLRGPPDAAFASVAVVAEAEAPCVHCGGDGCSPLGRLVLRMAQALADAPLGPETFKASRWTAESDLVHEAGALVAAVESLHDRIAHQDAPTAEALEHVRQQAAALGVQSLIVIGVCEVMASEHVRASDEAAS